MAKKLIHKYEFTPSTRKVKFFDLIRRERILLITNITDNTIIYNFGDPSVGATAFTQDTTAKTTELLWLLTLRQCQQQINYKLL